MNAHATSIAIRNDSNSATRRLVAAAMLAILLLNATIALARADSNNPFPGTQNDFTNQCRSLGGTPHREATHIVSCTWPNGGKQTCDFNQKPNSCTYTPPPKAAPSSTGNANAGNISAADQPLVQADSGVTTQGNVSSTDGVLVADSQIAPVEANVSEAPSIEAQTQQTDSSSAPMQETSGNVDSLSTLEETGS